MNTLKQFVIALATALFAMTNTIAQSASSVAIQSIRSQGTDLLIEVELTSAATRVVLESRARVDRGAWQPLAIQYVKEFVAPSMVLSFKVPASASTGVIRARADATTALPASFYTGTNSFSNSSTSGARREDVLTTADGGGGGTGENAPARDVVESDIWKIRGDTLYFYNYQRGLQVIDIANPDQPVVRGTYNLPAAGEQMYLLGTDHVALLARSSCWNGFSDQSEVALLSVTANNPQKVAEVPIPGSIVESRLVGTALYVVSSLYRQIQVTSDGGSPSVIWASGNQITSIDLSDPAQPKVRLSEWIEAYGNAVYATDRLLFVAGPESYSDWYNTSIHVFDISAPDATTSKVSVIKSSGRVADKFKMQLDGDVFTFVTFNWHTSAETRVETYRLQDPRSPQKLGSLLVTQNEQLFATRFAGKLLYVVTFERIDPLWIIDLTDPTQPRKVSELEIPGWSTYIQPIGDRLLTVGWDTDGGGWRTAMQLFDVSDPAKPALLSRELLGDRFSSTEANYNEKALTVVPEQQLILLPIYTYTETGSKQGVQIIDLLPNSLDPRGFIDLADMARRATPHRDRIISISGNEIVTVDAADRDNPRITQRTELSWAVERVVVAGDYIIEVGNRAYREPTLAVAPVSDPYQLLNRINLAELSLLGISARDQKLFVFQGEPEQLAWPQIWNPTNNAPIGTNAGSMVLSVFDLTKLPQLALLGRVQTEHHDQGWQQYAPLWPKDDVLVWGPRANSGMNWLWDIWPARSEPRTTFVSGAVSDASIVGSPIFWFGGGGMRFVAYDVADSTKPALASDIDLRGTNQWWSVSSTHLSGSLAYVSHEESKWDPEFQPPPFVSLQWVDGKQVTVTNEQPKGAWIQRDFLDVIDYADAKEPAVRNPVNIPGALIGIARDGNLLFTRSTLRSDTNWWSYAEVVSAAAYDGVSAHLIDSLPVPSYWQAAVISHGENLVMGQLGEWVTGPDGKQELKAKPAIEVFALSEQGKFTSRNRIEVEQAPQSFERLNDVLAARIGSELQFFNANKLPALQVLGTFQSCLWWDSLNGADGNATRGVWLPLGSYGVQYVPFAPAP